MSRQHIPAIGISLTLAAYFVLSLFSALNKSVQEIGFPASQVMFFDGVVGACCMVALAGLRGGVRSLKMKDVPRQLALVALNVTGAFLTFRAYPHLALVSAYLISFTGSLMITALSAVVLKERIRPRQVVAILTGFAGGVIALGPQEVMVNAAVMTMFAGIAMFAVAQVMIRVLSETESTWSFPFYYYIGMMLLSGIFFHGHFIMPHQPREWGMLMGLGLLDAASLAMMYLGLKYARASTVAPFQYSSLLWVVLLDMVLWDKFPAANTWLGGAIVILAGIYLATDGRRGRRKKREGLERT